MRDRRLVSNRDPPRGGEVCRPETNIPLGGPSPEVRRTRKLIPTCENAKNPAAFPLNRAHPHRHHAPVRGALRHAQTARASSDDPWHGPGGALIPDRWYLRLPVTVPRGCDTYNPLSAEACAGARRPPRIRSRMPFHTPLPAEIRLGGRMREPVRPRSADLLCTRPRYAACCGCSPGDRLRGSPGRPACASLRCRDRRPGRADRRPGRWRPRWPPWG